MSQTPSDIWIDISYYFHEVYNCIHLKAFLASLPVVYTMHFLGEWHLFEILFSTMGADLGLRLMLTCQSKKVRWCKIVHRIRKWIIRVVAACLTIIAIGVVTHAVSIGLKYDIPILNVVMVLLITLEMNSVLRNLIRLGLPIHPAIMWAVKVLGKSAYDRLMDTVNLQDRKGLRRSYEKEKHELPKLKEENDENFETYPVRDE